MVTPLTWATNVGQAVEPPTAKKNQGWNPKEPAGAQHINWWMKHVDEYMARVALSFVPHEQASPDMTVRLEAGALWDGDLLVEVAAQSTGVIVAPTVDPRIDRVVRDRAGAGVVSVITGTEAPSPVAPVITAGLAPVCQINLIVSQSTIVNADITDERQAIDGPDDRRNFAADTGVADAYVVTLAPVVGAYYTGLTVRFKAADRNTGASTINVNGLGAKDILRERAGALQGGEIETNGIYECEYDGTQFLLRNPAVPIGPIARDGLVLSLDAGDVSHDVNATAGKIMDSTGVWPMILTAEITKKIDVDWVAGDDQGGFPSALTLTDSVWYHFFIIGKKSDPFDTDLGFDTSLTAVNLLADATGYDIHKRILSVLHGAQTTSVIDPFTHYLLPSGYNVVLWDDPPLDVDITNQDTTAINYVVSVPLGFNVMGDFNIITQNQQLYISNPDVDDELPSLTVAPLISVDGITSQGAYANRILTNISSQIRARADGANSEIKIATLGWEE